MIGDGLPFFSLEEGNPLDIGTLLYLTWRTNKDLLSSTGNSAQYSVITLWFPGGRIREGIVRESGMDRDTLLYLK